MQLQSLSFFLGSLKARSLELNITIGEQDQKLSSFIPMDLSALPEDCLLHILSLLTSPMDVLRLSLVSKPFLSASDNEDLWEKFVPSDYIDIISNDSKPLSFDWLSKKELFFHLCTQPVLIEDGKMSIVLDKWSGKKCLMSGARSLAIEWGNNPHYCIWKFLPESRGLEVAVHPGSRRCLLLIKAKFHTKFLSPNTTYGLYFVFKKGKESLGSTLMELVDLTEVDESRRGMFKDNHHVLAAEVVFNLDKCRRQPTRSFVLNDDDEERIEIEMGRDRDREWMETRRGNEWMKEIKKMGDEWMEIEIGRYNVGVDGANDGKVLEMTLIEVGYKYREQALVVHGIEFRPLITTTFNIIPLPPKLPRCGKEGLVVHNL